MIDVNDMPQTFTCYNVEDVQEAYDEFKEKKDGDRECKRIALIMKAEVERRHP